MTSGINFLLMGEVSPRSNSLKKKRKNQEINVNTSQDALEKIETSINCDPTSSDQMNTTVNYEPLYNSSKIHKKIIFSR